MIGLAVRAPAPAGDAQAMPVGSSGASDAAAAAVAGSAPEGHAPAQHSVSQAEPSTGHAAPAEAPAPSAAPASPAAGSPAAGSPAAAETVDVWTCGSNDTTGLSWESKCPDGSAMKKVAVKRSSLKDLENAHCPICGMKTDGSNFAIHAGQLVRIGCRGCDDKFLNDPQAAVDKAKTEGK